MGVIMNFHSERILLSLVVALASALAAAQAALAANADRVRLARGSESGEVVKMTPLEVTLDKAGGSGSQAIAVNQIKSIQFDGEPPELAQARVNAGNGAYAKALQLLAKIDMKLVQRDFIRQDIEYYRAYCASRLALAGEGQVADAGRQLNQFVRSHPDNFHYLDACELMGDLLMVSGRFDSAEKQYSELS